MSKKHDRIFDDVLSGLDAPDTAPQDRGGARFLKRSTTIGERISGELEEKTLHWVDPARCRMWERHNRDYALLNEENCRDLIDGIRAQGRQEFPAIVRRVDDSRYEFEVVCGARRHFAVSWLRANNYPQFKYLVELRDLTDEEAFRLADIENRDREDISDYERAIDYADAIERYYGGRQKAMAERLEVSQPWLSRYLQLAKLPEAIVTAFASIRDLRERHARDLKPLLATPETGALLMAEARNLTAEQARARVGKGGFVDAAVVMKRLKRAATLTKPARPKDLAEREFRRTAHDRAMTMRKKGRRIQLEFDDTMTRASLEAAWQKFLDYRFEDQ